MNILLKHLFYTIIILYLVYFFLRTLLQILSKQKKMFKIRLKKNTTKIMKYYFKLNFLTFFFLIHQVNILNENRTSSVVKENVIIVS